LRWDCNRHIPGHSGRLPKAKGSQDITLLHPHLSLFIQRNVDVRGTVLRIGNGAALCAHLDELRPDAGEAPAKGGGLGNEELDCCLLGTWDAGEPTIKGVRGPDGLSNGDLGCCIRCWGVWGSELGTFRAFNLMLAR